MRGFYSGLLAYGVMSCVFFGLIAGMTGCAGPSTRVLPRAADGEIAYDLPEEIPVLEEANPFYLQESIGILTDSPCIGGSKYEGEMTRYMEQLLSDYGYKTERQRFRLETTEKTIIGTNVEAIRKAPDSEADLLIVCTHHDTLPDSPGANASASGVAAMLEIARLLSKLPSDTEIRFVSFSSHANGGLGARYYTDSLTRREKERLIGVLIFDELGYVSDSKLILGTTDGKPTFLGNQIKDASGDILGENWPYQIRRDAEIGDFHAVSVPAVTLRQESRAFEYGTAMDRLDIVDIDRIAQAVDVVSQAISEIMDTNTPSMIAKSRYYNDLRDGSFVQDTRDLLLFGMDLETVENHVGIRGSLDVVNQDSAGKAIEKYQFRMKWFNTDQIIITNYYFLDGMLDSVSLEADQAGITFDEMKERLDNIYGMPEEKNQGPNGMGYEWTDSIYHKQISLIPSSDSYSLDICGDNSEKVILEQRGNDDRILYQLDHDARTPLVIDLLHDIFPSDVYEKIGVITLYRDGLGETEMYIQPTEALSKNADSEELKKTQEDRPAMWELGIDIDDALTEEGLWRNRTNTIIQLTRLYAEMNEAEDADPAFKDDFVKFVLCAKPVEAAGEQETRILALYEQEDFVSYRRWVRNNLKLYFNMSEYE